MTLIDLHIHRWFKPITAIVRHDSKVSKESQSMKQHRIRGIALGLSAIIMSVAMSGPAIAAPNPGKKACVKEARTLCPAEMKSLSRKKVEACMIRNIEKTSPTCKSAMLQIKAERETTARRLANGQAATSE